MVENNAQVRQGLTVIEPDQLELAKLIVSVLNLGIDPSTIDPDAALYGPGLGLDSIDILEVALAISKSYGVQLRSDDKKNQEIFGSLRSLNNHIKQYRTK